MGISATGARRGSKKGQKVPFLDPFLDPFLTGFSKISLKRAGFGQGLEKGLKRVSKNHHFLEVQNPFSA